MNTSKMFFFVLMISFNLLAVVDLEKVRFYQKSGKLLEFKLASKKAKGLGFSKEDQKIMADIEAVKRFLDEQKTVIDQGQLEIRRLAQQRFWLEMFALYLPSESISTTR